LMSFEEFSQRLETEHPERMGQAREIYDYYREHPGKFEQGRSFEQAGQPKLARVFCSVAERAVQGVKQEKAPAGQWMGTLKNAGVKAEELEWLDLDNWLKSHNGPVSKAEVLDYINAHKIEVREVEKGERPPGRMTDAQRARHFELEERVVQHDETLSPEEMAEYERLDDAVMREDYSPERGGNTKFGSYTLPGGENYRELLLTLPPSQLKDWAVMNSRGRVVERLPT